MTFEEEMEIYDVFEKYQKATGGKEPIRRLIPTGYPKGVEEMGGEIAVYRECIKKKITWEKLLNYKNAPADVEL